MPFTLTPELLAAIISGIVGFGGFIVGAYGTIHTNKRLDAQQRVAETQTNQLIKRSEIDLLHDELDRLAERLKKEEERGDAAEAQVATLLKELGAVKKENECLLARVSELETQGAQKDKKIADQAKRIAELESQVGELKQAAR